MINKLRGWIPALFFVLGMSFVSGPELFVHRMIDALRRKNPRARRRRETSWMFRWARIYGVFIKTMMGIRMPITMVGEVTRGQPCILVFNHRTAVDHLFAAEVIKSLGLDYVLWVLKEEMRRAPILGPSCVRAGYAFVTRKDGSGDRERIRKMARMAREDGAGVAIYAEGTRFDGFPKEGSRFTHVRQPKVGGFQTFMEELPEYPIVFACLDWKHLRGSKTILDGDGLLGIKGAVTVWEHRRVPGEDPREVLDTAWNLMDRLMSEI